MPFTVGDVREYSAFRNEILEAGRLSAEWPPKLADWFDERGEDHLGTLCRYLAWYRVRPAPFWGDYGWTVFDDENQWTFGVNHHAGYYYVRRCYVSEPAPPGLVYGAVWASNRGSLRLRMPPDNLSAPFGWEPDGEGHGLAEFPVLDWFLPELAGVFGLFLHRKGRVRRNDVLHSHRRRLGEEWRLPGRRKVFSTV